LRNIVVCGGTSLLPGFTERVRRELFAQVSSDIPRNDIIVSADSQRKNAAWIGNFHLLELEELIQ
jgi:actin-related protein